MIAGLTTTGVLSAGYLTARLLQGECQNTVLKNGFSSNVTNFMGTWYEMERTSNIPFEKGTCVTANYTLLETGDITVLNS